jgi:hypothetical protein
MELDASSQERQQAHALLDMLPAEKLNAVRNLLDVMVEPLAHSLAMALDHARARLARGEAITHEEILREFGVNK